MLWLCQLYSRVIQLYIHMLSILFPILFPFRLLQSVEQSFLHPTVGLDQPEEEMDLDYCRRAYHGEVRYALSNSLGFGGHNASLLIKKYEV